jgi:hypothetical protein
MKIDRPKFTFSTWLELAAFQAIEFAQPFVEQTLSYDFKFELQLNMANDDLAEGDFELYPADDGRIVQCDSVEAVAQELVRNDRIPAWIDISAYKHSASFTLMRLICAGRFTDDTDELYYLNRGTGCFQFISPGLPPGYVDGQKFALAKI